MLFLPCSKGLETLLHREIKALGISAKPSYCGVYVEDMSMETILTLNYCCRFASRVLFPLGRFKIYDRGSLHKRATRLPWEEYIAEGQTIAIDANVRHPKFKNSLFAAQVLKDAICDRLRDKRGSRPSVDTKAPDVQLNLFIEDDWATISFDTSGQPLFKRGWRKESVHAPLQETLAAALLTFAGYTGEQTLCDPCCGSGTILIEAAMIATRTPPGYYRERWGFTSMPGFDPSLWEAVRARHDANITPLKAARIWGSDVDASARQSAQKNVRSAGFNIQIMRQPKPSDLVVTNPPFGIRMGRPLDLTALPGKRTVVIHPVDGAPEGKTLAKISNGGIPCAVIQLDQSGLS